MATAQFVSQFQSGNAQFVSHFTPAEPVDPPGDSASVINGFPAFLYFSTIPGTIYSGVLIPPAPPVNPEFPFWLLDPAAIRCLLVEVAVLSGGEIVRYLSSRPFRSAASDAPGNTVYQSVVVGSSVRTVERMGVDSENAYLSFGDIELSNVDGALDDWLIDDIWSNRPIRVYLGDVRWPRADYQTVFDGVVEDIGTRSRNSINLKLRDKLQRLNMPVIETTLGGTTNNKNQLIPLTFGECHNVSPLLTNPATLEYQVHRGTMERLIEVRDNGVPVAATPSLGAGKFTLPVQPFGRVTASVQGDKPFGVWLTTAKQLIERLVTAYGDPSNRFEAVDLDSTQLAAFDSANPQPLGVYLSSRENMLNLCNRIAAAVGARLVMSRSGQLRLIKVELPAPGTQFEITPDDILLGSMRVTDKLPVQAGISIGFCRNWTVQDPLDTRIPNAHKDLYARDWLITTSSDGATKTNYRMDGDPEQADNFLLTEVDAAAEATRLLNLFKTPRFVIGFDATARALQLELGQAINITYPRFGLQAGKAGMVIGLSPDWDRAQVSVEVLV